VRWADIAICTDFDSFVHASIFSAFVHRVDFFRALLLEDTFGHCTGIQKLLLEIVGFVFVSAGVVVRSVPAEARQLLTILASVRWADIAICTDF
jgi:hypothetical protein